MDTRRSIVQCGSPQKGTQTAVNSSFCFNTRIQSVVQSVFSRLYSHNPLRLYNEGQTGY